jgi:hypothetical protein
MTIRPRRKERPRAAGCQQGKQEEETTIRHLLN